MKPTAFLKPHSFLNFPALTLLKRKGNDKVTRLSSISSSLSRQMKNTLAAERLDAILSVCHQAVMEIGDVSPLIHQALCLTAPDNALRVQIEELREKLDDQYFDAQKKADDSSSTAALKLFSKARLAAAIAMIMSPLDAATACEALYEALMALQDNRPTIQRLELTLS